jgi:diguanylate cyclase (GGDEF)-like protein
MALSFSLTSDLPRKADDPAFDYFDFWRRSLTMAVAGRALARLVRSPSGDEAFLCGLLGRLGQLVMARCIPGEYGRILERSEGELPSGALEQQLLGYDFHQIGAGLLRSWELPGVIVEAIRHWGDPERSPDPAGRDLARLLNLSDITAAVICTSRKGSALRSLHERATEYCGISEQEIDAFIVSLEADVTAMAEMLNVDVDRDSYQGILDRARMEMVQISLGTAAALEQTSSRAAELERANQALADEASTDKLTGIANRARFDKILERVVEARLAGDSDQALGVLIIDVDHFKRFNDSHGHQVGDEVLKLVAECLKAATRGTDLAARYGGEEFVVVVANTSLDILETIAERIRTRIEGASLEHQDVALSVTASIGGSCVKRVHGKADGTALVALADANLYEAKRAGRNRCVCRQVETTQGA